MNATSDAARLSLLAPFWMLLASAAAVPLLLHLLRRRTGVRAEFPAARYLQRAEREHSRSLRLRNLLLMLLRVLVILLVALAAARPVARWAGLAHGRAPAALAVVVDNSLSTSVIDGGRPVFEVLRDSARLLLDETRSDDRVWVVTADARLHGGTAATARAALDSLTTSSGAGDLAAAIARAAAVVTGMPGLAPRIAVFTDGQRSAWAQRVVVADAVGVVVSSPSSAAPSNRGVIGVTPRPAHWMPRGSLAIVVHSRDSAGFHVAVQTGDGGSRLIGRGVAAPAGETMLAVAPADTGWYGGYVEIDRDEMPGDDRRYFAVWAGAAPGVSATPGAGPFVASALAVLRGGSRFRDGGDIQFASPSQIGTPSTGVFVVPPASAAGIGAANQALARHGIPWRFAPRHGDGRITSPAAIAGTMVRVAYDLVPTSTAAVDTIARIDARPWAIAGETAGVSPGIGYVIVASPLTPAATDLPVRAPFVPWIVSVIQEHLAGAPGAVVHAAPAADVARPVLADSLVRADGTVIALGARFTAPALPGVHFFLRDGQRAGALVVNAEENESVLQRLAQDEVADLIDGPEVSVASSSRTWRADLLAGVGATSLVVPTVCAVLLLLAAELVATTFRTRGMA